MPARRSLPPPDFSGAGATLDAPGAAPTRVSRRRSRTGGARARRALRNRTPAPPVPARDTVRLSAESLDQLLHTDRATAHRRTCNRRRLTTELPSASPGSWPRCQREWESVQRTSAGRLRRLGEHAGAGRDRALSRPRRARGDRLVAADARRAAGAAAIFLVGEAAGRATPGRRPPGPHGAGRERVPGLPQDDARPGPRRGQGDRVPRRGFEVQADRMVLQALKDPLMHMLRNAVSHGIEPPRERRSAGKSPSGQVTLRHSNPRQPPARSPSRTTAAGIDCRPGRARSPSARPALRGRGRGTAAGRADPAAVPAGLLAPRAWSPSCPAAAWACRSCTKR